MSVCCLNVLTLTVAVCENWRLWSPYHNYAKLSTCLALNKMHYSVLPRHLHYSILMSCSCCAMFDLALALVLSIWIFVLPVRVLVLALSTCLGLGLGLACQGLGLGLELLTTESWIQACLLSRYWWCSYVLCTGNNPTNVCERCAGLTLETRCTCNDPFGGFSGAFECMASGAGDVAFVRNTTILEYVKQPNATLTEAVSFCRFLARDSIYAIAHYMLSSVRLYPVCLSVTRTDQSKTVEVRITQPSPQSSPMTLVFWRLTSPWNSKGKIGSGAPNMGGVWKICNFQPISHRISETVQDMTKVTINH